MPAIQQWSPYGKGEGDATADNPAVRIRKNQQFTFSGGRSLRYVVSNAPGFDGFDSWCQVRARREDKSGSLHYVSPYAVGYSDLDEYGRWQEISPYGPVWVPSTVAVGWAPYRWGHWISIAPWGWTWVDDAPTSEITVYLRPGKSKRKSTLLVWIIHVHVGPSIAVKDRFQRRIATGRSR